MTTVAVTGAGGDVARALVARLAADPGVERIIAVDLVEPQMPPAKLEFRAADLRDPLLGVALDGADVVVHLGITPGPERAEDRMFAINVHGTRNVLAAVGAVGAGRLVHLSSGTVYGAHPDNPVPLDEGAPLRANPDFSWAYHHLLAEELVAGFDADSPATTVVVLRPATVLGEGVSGFVARHFEQPVLPLLRGLAPPVQLLDTEDLATALHLAVSGDLAGPYNVAPDGWLTVRELARLLGKPVLPVGEAVAFAVSGALWRRGLLEAPPGALHYLAYPWVLSCDRLHAAGWAPARSNREVARAFAAQHRGWLRVGRFRCRRRDAALAAGAVGGVAAAGVLHRVCRPWPGRAVRAHRRPVRRAA